jgi:hypothetical protein
MAYAIDRQVVNTKLPTEFILYIKKYNNYTFFETELSFHHIGCIIWGDKKYCVRKLCIP